MLFRSSEIPAERVNKPGSNKPGSPGALSTTFFRATKDAPDAPTAALNRYPGGESRYSAAHFHEVDQFQVIMEGSGDFGRHAVKPYYVHFSRAYTPYGPLISAKDTGWGFIVLRSRLDSGAQRFPDSLPKLKSIPNRKPWQVTAEARFPDANGGVATLDIEEIRDDQGLFTRTLTMAPNAHTLTPEQGGGDGQYVVAVKGSLMHDGVEKKAPAVIFLRRDEPQIELKAGADGAQAIIMNYPKVEQPAVEAKPSSDNADKKFKIYQCLLCAFMYDEAAGLPDEGIAPGTRWADVPDTWTCPDCSASKADFDMIEVGTT